MYLLYAPKEKFGFIAPNTPLLTDEVKFTNNIAYCPKSYWTKWHLHRGCLDITPRLLKKLRKSRMLRSILIIAQGGFGDSMWIMPFAKAMFHAYPRTQIIIMTEEKNMPLWQHVTYAHKCVPDDYWTKQMYIRQADEVYDFGGVATMIQKYKKKDPIEAIFDMAEEPLPKDKKDCRPEIRLLVEEGKKAEETLFKNGIDIAKDIIVTIALEASTANRTWPFSYVESLSRLLVSNNIKVVWLSTTQDYQDTYFFKCHCGWEGTFKLSTPPLNISFTCPVCKSDNTGLKCEHIPGVANLATLTTIREAASIIALSDVFVGPNSGLMVVSTAMDIPTVGLFGAFDPRARAKFYDKFIGLMGRPDCAPCDKHWTACEKGEPAPCMRMISPEKVFEAIKKLRAMYPKNISARRPII